MSDKLTPDELENAKREAADYADWLMSYPPRSDAHVAGGAMHALLSHITAQDAELVAAQTTIQAARDSAAHNAAEAERVGALLREADAENARLRRVADNMAGADWTVLPRRSPHTSPEAAEQMAVDGWRFRGYDINRNFLLWYRPWNDVSEQDAANE